MPPARTINTILLDLDDTLHPEREYVLSGFGAVARFLKAQFGHDEDAVLSWLTRYTDRHGRKRVFDALLNDLGHEFQGLIPTLLHIYRTHDPFLRLYPDVLPSFEIFKSKGCKIGIVTDGKSCVQMRKISALGLAKYIDLVVCTDDLDGDASKPSVVPFQVALSRLSADSQSTVYVGDDLSKDFLGPRQLGMATLRVDRCWSHPLQPRTDFPAEYAADYTVTDLHAVVSWFFSSNSKSA